mgnify:FL=1
MAFTTPVLAQKISNINLKWKIAAEFPADSGEQHSLGFAGPVTGVYNNILFIAGGANFPTGMPWQGGKKKYYNKVFVYTRTQNKIVPHKKSFTLPTNIAYPATCNTPLGVFYAGGENENGISNKAWLMTWDNKTRQPLFKVLPNLIVPLSNAAATLVGNTVYIAGGETSSSASSQLIALDLNNTTAGWKQVSTLPKLISHTLFLATKNKLYLVGGRKKTAQGISDLYSSVYEFNILTNQWKEMQPLPYVLSAGTGAVSKNQLLVFGGDKGETFHKTEMLIAAINAEKDEAKKQELIKEKNKLQAQHPGFSNEILQYDIKTNTWKPIGKIPFATPVTTTAVKWKTCYIIPSGEIKAGVRSPNILSVKILQ